MEPEDERSSSEDEAPVESLIQGRERRSTAGRHMSALLNAEADDELALLFEEVDDDNEFAVDGAEEGGEEDDMGLESSSDEEDDQGPNTQADDLEGERQIEKEEKEEKRKKRAREDLRYKITSKKVKIDPTVAPTMSAPPRPRKKSERVSWIPTPEEGPTRSSSRRQTMQNKELTHARLKDSEEKRIRLIATMEEAARRKAKLKPKEMTQEEHLAEAERVERLNRKTLNRWEEMEKRKAEERRAKIEALQNRRLEGPVISYWSGVATWADGRLTRVGKVNVTPKTEKEDGVRKKSKKADKEGKSETERKLENPAAVPAISQNEPPLTSSKNPTGLATSIVEPKQDQVSAQLSQQTAAINTGQGSDALPEKMSLNTNGEASNASSNPTLPPNTSTEAPISPLAPNKVPDSEAADTTKEKSAETESNQAAVEQSKIEAGDVIMTESSDGPTDHKSTSQPDETSAAKDDKRLDTEELPKREEDPSGVALESTANLSPTPQPTSEPARQTSPAQGVPTHTPLNAQGNMQPPAENDQKPDIHLGQSTATSEGSLHPVVPPSKVVENTGRCLTVLENFDDKTAQSREFSIYFNAKKPPRLTKISSSLCVITSLPSRYRDPDTSLPFANSYAYHEIRHTSAHKYSWSPMLGCYVGPVGIAARGVPDRFLNPDAKESSSNNNGSGDGSTASGKEKEAVAAVPASNNNPGASTPAVPPPAAPTPITPVAGDAGDAMDIDK